MSEHYTSFTAEDFAEDSFFIRWVQHADEDSDAFWSAFIRQHPELEPEIARARDIISFLNFKVAALDELSRNSVRNEILLTMRHEAIKDDLSDSRGRSRRWKQLLKVAAVVLVILTAVKMYRAPDTSVEGTDGYIAERWASEVTSTEERVNPRGQKSVLILPDGSKVWLNVDSKLSYPKDFKNAKKREVLLEGEAFFSVVHDDSIPFVVHTSSSIRIAVLGTSFNVKSYKDDRTVETTLVDGKVSIDRIEDGRPGANLVLSPNQRAVFFKESNTLNVEEVNASNLSAWRHDYLVFDEAPFEDVIVQLERWYDVDIHLPDTGDDSELPCTLTANIQDESLEDVLKLLETSHRISYSVRNDEVFIYGKLCNE